MGRRDGKEPGPLVRLAGRYLWRGDAGAKIAAITQFAVAVLAIVAAILGVTGAASITSSFFRAVALVVAAVILVALLVASEQWQEQAEELAELRNEIHDGLPDTIKTVVHHELKAASQAGVQEIPHDRVEEVLREILVDSTGWTFQGGSGRWLRSTTLPHLARVENTDKVRVKALLLDPRNEQLCLQWVASRFSQRYNEKSRDPEDPRKIQTNILATIYSLAWYGARSPIEPTIVLLDTFSSQRYDVGTIGLVITVATRSQPAIYAGRGSWFYETVRADLLKSSERNPSIDLPVPSPKGPRLYPRLKDIDADAVRAVLQRTTIDESPGLAKPLLDRFANADELDFKHIARAVRRPS